MDKTGLTRSSALADPPTRKSSWPDSACGLVPVTGASSNSQFPREALVASSLIHPTDKVLDSIRTALDLAPASAPFGPSHISREATSSATMLITTSAFNEAARGEFATDAPRSAKGLARSALRL